MKAGLCAVLFAGSLFADGGTVQLHQQAGPLMVTLFSASNPVRMGQEDFSVMLQNASSNAPVLNAQVVLRLSRAGQPVIRADATQALASNKLLYAAHPVIPASGRWRVQIQAVSAGNTVEVNGALDVQPPQSAIWNWWPYFAAVPGGILLFCVNRWLKGKQRAPGY